MTLPTVLVQIDFGGTVGVVDVSSYWDAVVGMEITQGRAGVGQDVSPGTLSLQLENQDGRFTPDNPASPYWPRIEAGATITVTATKSPDSRVLFKGEITDWQPEFPGGEPTRSFVRVSALDALGKLAGKTMRHIVHERAMAPDGNVAYAPLHYWPLDEPPGADGADNLTGGEALTLQVSADAWWASAADGIIDFEDVELATVPPITGATFTRSSATTGRYMSAVATGGSATSNEFEIILWLQTSATTSGVVGVGQWTLGDGTTVALVLNAGQPQVELTRPGGSLVLTTPLTIPALSLNVPHMVCIDMADEFGGEWVLYLSVDADQATDSTLVDPGTWDLSRVRVELGHAPAVFDSTRLTAATIAGVGIAGSVAQLNYYDLWQKGLATPQQIYGLDTTETRTRLIAARSGLAVPSLASDDGDDVGAQDFAGRSALEAMVELYRHRGAYLQATHTTSVLDVRGRGFQRPVTVAMTVSASEDAVGSPTFSRADFERVAVTTVSGLSGSTTYRDDALVAAIGYVEETVYSPLFYARDRYYAAQDRVAQGRYTRLRPQRIVVDLHTAVNDLYPSWLGANAWRLGSRHRITDLASSLFGYSEIDGWLEGYSERLTVDGYELTLDLSSIEPESLRFNTRRFAFGDGAATLSSGVTDSATSITIQWTGSALLSTSSGDYPMDLDLNGERVTIASAPGAGTSPRTLTVTRGVGGTVARAHSAGEPVEVWDAGRFGY